MTILLALEQPNPRKYSLLCGDLVFCAFILVPLGLRRCRAIFLAWARSVDNFVITDDVRALRGWYSTQMKFFEGSSMMLVAGLGLACTAELAFTHGRYLDGFIGLGKVWAEFVVFVAALFAGCSLWAIYKAKAAVSDLGRAWGPQMVVVTGSFGILGTGHALAQCWMIIGAIWFAYTFSALFGPSDASFTETLQSYPVVLLGAPTLPFILGTFIQGQMPMHLAMVEYKRTQLHHIDVTLRQITPNRVSDLSKETQETIDFLLRRRAEAEALPEWPFRTIALARVGSSALTALVPLLIKGLISADLLKPLGAVLTD